jgi:NFU1 iron-sulfur cluster scaffold homolog, mitochondrial
MKEITIQNTQNPTIVKFVFDDFIVKGQSYEFKNIDEAKSSPLAQQLFYLPFVKTVYISGNFIAIERYSIVEWSDVQEEVREQIQNFVANGGTILNDDATPNKKIPVTVYAETTPNPNVMKFVSNKLLTTQSVSIENIEEARVSPLAKALYQFPFIKEIFIDQNYISVQKYDVVEWSEVSNEVRSFVKKFVEEGGVVVDIDALKSSPKKEIQEVANFENLDVTSQQIINILEEYVKPAVQSDGGNILFDSYDPNDNRVKVILQGACSGCPSSTFTLKNGIENMLKDMLQNQNIKVEAANM